MAESAISALDSNGVHIRDGDSSLRLKPTYSYPDIVPSHLLKKVFHTIGPSLLSVINISLMKGTVPSSFKHAVVQPLIKNPNLDPTDCNSFISKLLFMSNNLEKVVLAQLSSFLNENNGFHVT